MTAADWLRLAQEYGASFTIEGGLLNYKSAQPIPAENIAGLRQHRSEVIELVQIEDRRRRVMALFDHNPTAQRAYIAETDADPVIVTIGLSTGESGELLISRERYNPFLFLDCMRSFETETGQ